MTETIQKTSASVRFKRSILYGSIIAIALGFAVGLIRYSWFDFGFILIPIGFLLAITIKNVGRGVNVRFGLLSVLLTILAIYLSDILALDGLQGLLVFKNYTLVFQNIFNGTLNPLTWLLYRGISVYFAFAYARIL